MWKSVLDRLGSKSRDEIIEAIGTRDLIEIDRNDPRNEEIDRTIKGFGFYAILDGNDGNQQAQWILFTGPEGAQIIQLYLNESNDWFTLIPIEHASKLIEPGRLIEYALKEF